MTKPAFDNITKPGAKFETFKPNKAMQDVMQREMEAAGFIFEGGKMVGGPVGQGGKAVRIDK